MRNNNRIFLFLIVITLPGCNHSTDESNDSVVPNYRPNYPVSDNLNVPELSVGVGIESGYTYISWTKVENVTYYELEQSFEKTFVSSFLDYAGTENSLHKPPTSVHNYYRVRVIYNWTASRWSNISGH